MSVSVEEVHGVTFEEFLAAEQTSEHRHELVGGRVFVMAGGTERHELLTGLLYERLAPGARAHGCRPFQGGRLLRIEETGYYPDVLIACGPATDRLFDTTARLAVEVRSPSTQDVDRREKASAYARVEGLDLYLLVDPLERRIEVGRRRGTTWDWHAAGPGDVVATPFGDLDVDALHDDLDATATT